VSKAIVPVDLEVNTLSQVSASFLMVMMMVLVEASRVWNGRGCSEKGLKGLQRLVGWCGRIRCSKANREQKVKGS